MFKELIFLMAGVGLCLCSTLPEHPADSQPSSRFGDSNVYYLYNLKNYPRGDRVDISSVNKDLFTDGVTDTIILIHGQGGSKDSLFNKHLINSLLSYDNDNSNVKIDVIVVDWEYYASLPYSNSVLTVPRVASNIIQLIEKLTIEEEITTTPVDLPFGSKSITTVNKIHLVGFDLGAHVAGFVGRTSDGKIARITGLDPAGESWGALTPRLRESDAQYVEVIHTDAFGARPLGTSDPLGRIDIYPNGGTSQPGCNNNNACNHDFAWLLFVATIDVRNRSLNANSCNSMAEVTGNRCVGPTIPVGGLSSQKYGGGLYRANTVVNYPYF